MGLNLSGGKLLFGLHHCSEAKTRDFIEIVSILASNSQNAAFHSMTTGKDGFLPSINTSQRTQYEAMTWIVNPNICSMPLRTLL